MVRVRSHITPDSKWLLDQLLSEYAVKHIPSYAGWVASNAGSGLAAQEAFNLYVQTGTTPSSQGLFSAAARFLNVAGRTFYLINFDKRIELSFWFSRENSDPESVARVQLKSVNKEGALTNKGVGIEIDNTTVYGESYGTARGTVSLGTITLFRTVYVKIVHIPGQRVEFWLNNALVGTLTGNYVPSGETTDSFLVVSIINGPTGGVNARLWCSHFLIVHKL